MPHSKDTAAIVTYGDHEIITPENKLRGAVSKQASDQGNDDPVARAEKALAELSPEFASWMDSECDRLDRARHDLREGFTKPNKDALFHAAHDIKGEAATFGYPAVASAADSLCRLIDHTPEATRIPPQLIDQHVDAVRAIYREYARSDAKRLAKDLTKRLREVTDEFLISQNRDRPDVLAQLKAPSIVPE
ncbi:MAG TPA: Hpt domain-containing protein [Pseudolabrys sp.]|nr:Hpt domain-containing protein [Pseudolabrys sp.]